MNIVHDENKESVKKKHKMTIPLLWAIILILAVGSAGGLAYYSQLEKYRELLASSEQAMEDQQFQTLAAFDQIEKNLASIREHESMIQHDFADPESNSSMTPEERIQKEIDFIKYLLNENKNIIASFDRDNFELIKYSLKSNIQQEITLEKASEMYYLFTNLNNHSLLNGK